MVKNNKMANKANLSNLSAEVLTSILNNMDAYLYVSDPETNEILFINQKMIEHFNLKEPIVGEVCWKVFQNDTDHKCALCPGKDLLENPDKVIVWNEKSSVTNLYYKNTAYVIDWTDGRKVHLQHKVDITALKHAENSLKQRLGQQALMAKVSRNFISNEDIDTQINNVLRMTGEFTGAGRISIVRFDEHEESLIFTNSWYQENLNIDHSQATPRHFGPGEPMYEDLIVKKVPYISHEDLTKTNKYDFLVKMGGVRSFLTVPIYTGGSFWGMLTLDEFGKARKWNDNDIHLMSLLANTISMVAAREKISKELIRMSSIVNSAPQLILFYSSKKLFEYFNEGAVAMTGYSQEELLKDGMNLLFSPSEKDFIINEVVPTILKTGSFSCDLTFRHKNGEQKVMSTSAFLVNDSSNGIACIGTDITSKMELEKELLEAKEQAEQSNIAKSSFLSRMSHEIRTPMNAVIGMTHIAKNSDDVEKKEYCLDKIEEASVHLLGIINDILDMSKIEANKFELSESVFSLRNMIRRVVDVIDYKMEEKKQTFTLKIDENIPDTIETDEQHLSQVLTNLLSNAIKFTRENGSISLSASLLNIKEDKCKLQFCVSDNGIGISREQQSKLFQSFEQADGGISRKFGGTGLGLSISKNIVELMGGKIWVESVPQKGSIFTFNIPVKKAEESDKVIPAAAASMQTSLNGYTVLLAEDVALNREIAVAILSSAGAKVECAANGLEALDLFAENPHLYDVILMDIHMPIMDGFEATKMIRNLEVEKAKHIPIIAMTANVFREDIEECLSSGMNDHIGKPINIEEMISKIKINK